MKGPLDLPKRRLGGKSIWECLDLLSKLLIPLVVVLATIGFGWWQTQLADHQHQHDQQLAKLQHQQDQQSATDQQEAATLQTYIGNMQDLLLNHRLSESKPGDEIRQVAREQTITTLRRLNAHRNTIVLQFLQDARLVGVQDAVINLSSADLSGDDLSGAHLSGIGLIGADLSNATLNGATLNGAALYGANLSGAGLIGADLSNAYLSDATLNGAHLNGATLSNATLTGAFLGDASLNGANLNGAHLNGATLTAAHLNGAHLSVATLNGANLRGADLSGADLSDADLSGDAPKLSGLTQPQLDKVSSCTNAKLKSTGLTCHHRVGITLTYWYTESSAEAHVIPTLIDQFQQQNPNIKINAVNTPYSQTQAAFITNAQAGKAPDVLRSDVGWVTQFAAQRYLLNIDSYISQSDLSDYDLNAPLGSAPLGYDEYNGHLYGLPQTTDFLALLCNKAELAKAGITSPPPTTANFEHDAVKVVQSKAATYGFETNGQSYYALPFLYAFGGGMLDQHNNPLVNNAGSVAGLNFLLNLQNSDKVMPGHVNFSTGGIDTATDFMQGKTAMIFDGPWDVKNILTGTGSVFMRNPGNLEIAGIPTGPAGHTGSPLGGQSYVISAGTAHPAEAYNFIKFMSSTPSQVTIAKANHTLPTRQSAYQDGVSADPFIKAFLDITQTARVRPAIPQGGNLFYAFDPYIGAVLDGAQSPIDALNAVADAWKQLLAGS